MNQHDADARYDRKNAGAGPVFFVFLILYAMILYMNYKISNLESAVKELQQQRP